MPLQRASRLSAVALVGVSVCWSLSAAAQASAGFPPPPPSGATPPAAPSAPPQAPPGQYPQYPPGQYPGGYPQGYAPPAPYAQELGPFQRHRVDEAPLDRPGYVFQSRNAGRRLHDGFYLRLGGGIGFGGFSASTEPFQFYVQDSGLQKVDRFDGNATGFAYASQIAVGAAIRPGAILALSLNTVSVPQLTMSRPVAEFSSYEYKISQSVGVGPSFDFYPDPTAGLHFAAGLSVAGIIIGQADPTDGARARGHTVLGWGFNLGVGYDWWIGDEWSLGLQARLDYTHGTGTDARDNDWSHTLWAPTVGLGLTYN
ncbi:MAG: hypothetical protein R3B07_31525 [Polyangiaceae bacterium]